METDKKIIGYNILRDIGDRLRKEKKKIVFTAGCFDLLHVGHVFYLDYCKSKGDVLVVSIANDKNVASQKGDNRPIIDEIARARMLAALSVVDYVIIDEGMGKLDHNEVIINLEPNIYVTNSTDSVLEEKKKLIESVGGELYIFNRPEDNISTTNIEKRVKGS